MKKMMKIALITLMVSSGSVYANDTSKKTDTTTGTTWSRTADQDKWWHDRDINNDGRLSRSEYVKAETKDSKKTVREATEEFNREDSDRDGYINASEFKAWFEKMGDKVQSGAHELKNDASKTKEKVKKEYRESDINNNGK